MPHDRPNLSLDERSFEGLLSAAFTIQQHNDRRRRAQSDGAQAPTSVCGQCGAPKSAETSRCGTCGQDEFRPGERLQRNWATMWSESKSQELSETQREPQNQLHSQFQAEETSASSASAPAKSAFRLSEAPPDAGPAFPAEAIEPALPEPYRFEVPASVSENSSHLEEAAPVAASALSDYELEADPHVLAAYHTQPHATDTALVHSAFTFDPEPEHQLADQFDFQLEPKFDEEIHRSSHASLTQHISDLRVRLRFRRADLYLGVAVFIAAVALLWPSAAPRRPASLSAWERALVMIGIAEAPTPVVHLQGDPGVSVWVDPHTALYYCDGDEQYQHTPDGRLSSQHDAQMDRFEPAARVPCE